MSAGFIGLPGTFCKGSLRTVHSSNGGADGIRTHDLLDAIEARSQLRHGPTGTEAKSITGGGTSLTSSISPFPDFIILMAALLLV
jgi:hypothetical protein